MVLALADTGARNPAVLLRRLLEELDAGTTQPPARVLVVLEPADGSAPDVRLAGLGDRFTAAGLALAAATALVGLVMVPER